MWRSVGSRVVVRLGLVAAVMTLFWGGLRVVGGCATEETPTYADGGGGGNGAPCTVAEDCTLGYVCAGEGICKRAGEAGTQNLGQGCSFNTDCLIDLICSSFGQCVVPGEGGQGAPCVGNEACLKGLLCSSSGQCAKPGDPGTLVPGETCSTAGDCAFGLVCVDTVCTQISYWPGVECEADDGPLRAYFEVPRNGTPVKEFYRLPFPNDIRLKGGKVDVSDHPNPGSDFSTEVAEIVGGYLKAIDEDVTGFGLNTTTFLRVSKPFDLNTIKLDYVNLDPNAPAHLKKVPYSMWATTGRGKYICNNFIAIRPPVGKPLQAKTPYAVLLRQGIKDSAGNEAAQDADFTVMMQDSPPTDAALTAAWTAYQPLRDYLKTEGINPSTVLSAAVFTTMDPRDKMRRFRDVIYNQADAPATTDLTLCDGATKSPCDDGTSDNHKCPPQVDGAYHELHGTYKTPRFQTGTKPYKTAADGGAIAYDSGHNPIIQGYDDACFTLTLPKNGTMPADGWPVVIFAHGTGGSMRSFINNGTATNLVNITDDSGTVARMAAISIDGSQHGPRSGMSSEDTPEELFFNVRNPRAARDNILQGAADKMQLVRLIQSIDYDDASSPTGAAFKLDKNKIYFFGHSQGTIEGVPFLAFEPEVKGTVLSGAGGYLIASLLGKTKPLNIAGLIKLALADTDVGKSHPMLNLFQLFFEEVDAVNFGRAIFTETEPNVPPKHTFLGAGLADSFTPLESINALGWSMGIRKLRQSAQRCDDGVCSGTESCKTCPSDCGECPKGTTCGDGTCEAPDEKCNNCPEDCLPCPPTYALDDAPVSGNVTKNGDKYTCSMVDYVSDGTYDDHFVLFQNPSGLKQSTQFLGTAVRDGVPTVPAE